MGDHVDAIAMFLFCFVFALVQHAVPLRSQWLLAKLFPAAWAGSSGQCTVYLSLMSVATGEVSLYH
jgi:hypothetical protein